GLFWVNADVKKEALEARFHGILSILNPAVPDLKTFRDSGRNATTELEKALRELPSSDRVLFVVDNVPETRPRELSTWCPAIGKVATLFTSRRNLALFTPGLDKLILRPLSDAASVDLLTKEVSRRRLSEKAWWDIADWV